MDRCVAVIPTRGTSARFPAILGEYVRNRGLLRLEDAVRKMTSLNAAKVGLLDRGLLRPGQFADVVIFDPATVIDHSTYLEPFQYSTGIIHVLVNGKLVLENGQPVKGSARTCPASRPVVVDRRQASSRSRQIKNRPENGSQTTTSPLVVQNPIDWPVGRESSSVTTHARICGLRKGERGVVRGNPLALWRGAAPSS